MTPAITVLTPTFNRAVVDARGLDSRYLWHARGLAQEAVDGYRTILATRLNRVMVRD
jgi:hypothetical protein